MEISARMSYYNYNKIPEHYDILKHSRLDYFKNQLCILLNCRPSCQRTNTLQLHIEYIQYSIVASLQTNRTAPTCKIMLLWNNTEPALWKCKSALYFISTEFLIGCAFRSSNNTPFGIILAQCVPRAKGKKAKKQGRQWRCCSFSFQHVTTM